MDCIDDEVLAIRERLARDRSDEAAWQEVALQCHRDAMRLVSRAPESAEAHVLLGDCSILLHLGDGSEMEEARCAYERAAELAPCDPEPFESLGHLYNIVNEDGVHAERLFLKALALGGGAEARIGLINALLDQCRISEARIERQRLDDGAVPKRQLDEVLFNIRDAERSCDHDSDAE